MIRLRFEAVGKSLAGRRVLDGLSLTVEDGDGYGLLGPNGCGKSTAINVLCNLLAPDAGSVEIAGRPASEDTRRLVGFCPQEIALYRDLCPAENLRFFGELYGLHAGEGERRVSELMRLFELEPFAGTPVGALSGGWQRRVNIAAALVHSPSILVLDEPTTAVDLGARHALWRLLEELRTDGTTLLLTTHHLEEADRLCTRVGIMKEGRIAKEGSVAELVAAVPGRAVALVESSDEGAVARRARQLGWGLRRYATRLGCLLPQPTTLRDVVAAFDGIDVSAVSLQPVGLEHAYLEVIDGATPGTSGAPSDGDGSCR